MRNLCDAAKMSCDVTALPFQAQDNYLTWSIDFVFKFIHLYKLNADIYT